MNLRILLALLVILPATAALAAEGTFDKTLMVSGAPSVSISAGAGYVHVYPGADNQVHVIGHVHATEGWFDSDADARVKQIVASPPIVQSGNIITISTPDEDFHFFHDVFIDYDVTTPRATTLKARAGSGGIEIGGIAGTVNAGAGSGSIHVDNIGANSRLGTGSGRIRATDVHGAAMVQTGSGSIELSLSAPGDVRAQTGSGSIHIDGPIVMQGNLNNHHVTGAINGGGPTVRASTGSGSIRIH